MNRTITLDLDELLGSEFFDQDELRGMVIHRIAEMFSGEQEGLQRVISRAIEDETRTHVKGTIPDTLDTLEFPNTNIYGEPKGLSRTFREVVAEEVRKATQLKDDWHRDKTALQEYVAKTFSDLKSAIKKEVQEQLRGMVQEQMETFLKSMAAYKLVNEVSRKEPS